MDPNNPQRPKYLMFSGQNLPAKFPEGGKVSFSAAEDGKNQMIQIPIRLAKGVRASIYSKPDASTLVVGDMGDVGESLVYYTRALTDGTMPYVIDGLRNLGWKGSSLAALAAGKLEGLGETNVTVTIDVKENTVKDGQTVRRVDDKGNFRPIMEVAFINRAGGFQKEATATDMAALDRKFAKFLGGKTAPAAAGATGETGGDFPPAGSDDIPF